MEKKDKNYLKAKEYLNKAIELLKNNEFDQAEACVQKVIEIIGTNFKVLSVVGQINTKDTDNVRLALETLGLILLNNNAYLAAMQSFSLSRILLEQMIEKKSFKYVKDKYRDYLFNTSFFTDFALGMHNWFTNNFETAIANFKNAIFRLEQNSEMIEYLEKTLCLLDADRKFMSLFEIGDPSCFYEVLSEIKHWKINDYMGSICKANHPIPYSLPEVTEVITGRGFCVISYTHFLRTLFDLLRQLEDITIGDDVIRRIKERFKQIRGKNEVIQIGEKFLFACIDALNRYKNLKSIPKYRYGRLMNLLQPIWPIYTKCMNSLLIGKTRQSFIKNNILQLCNQIDPLVFLVYEEKLFPKAEEEKAEYARMWSNQTKPEGEPINEQKFNELVKNKRGYKIFIIDRGEYEMGSVGEVYLNNDMILKQEDYEGKKTKHRKEKDYLTPYEYKLLVYTLKNKYRAGTIIELVEKCWGKKTLVSGPGGLREDFRTDKDAFMRKTSTYRKTIANISTLLNDKISVKLRSHKTGSYSLTGKPEFCLLEITV